MRFKKGMALMLALIMLMSFGSFSGAESAAADAIVNLKTEGMVHPLGVNTDTPSFSWQMRSGRTGAAGEWMMAYQLGIAADPAAPGYQHFILQPTAGGDFTFARGSYDSVYGPISSGWTAEGGVMTSYDAVVPANTSAALYLPAGEGTDIPEGAVLKGISVHHGIEVLEIELPAGQWHFDIR